MIYLTIYLFLFLPFWLFFGLLTEALQPFSDISVKIVVSFFCAVVWPIIITSMVIARFYNFLRIKEK